MQMHRQTAHAHYAVTDAQTDCMCALSILYPDNGVRLCVCASVRHGSDVTSHLRPYQCVYCERYSDVATLPRYCFRVQ